MARFVTAEQGHVINILPPQDVAAGVSSDVFSMKDAQHATIIVQAGATDADGGNITVEACDNFTPTTHTEIAFNYYAETTDAGDTLGARTAAEAATGIDVSANDNIFYVIEIDEEELPEGKNNIRISWSACGGATYGSAVAILSGLAYQGSENRTQIA